MDRLIQFQVDKWVGVHEIPTSNDWGQYVIRLRVTVSVVIAFKIFLLQSPSIHYFTVDLSLMLFPISSLSRLFCECDFAKKLSLRLHRNLPAWGKIKRKVEFVEVSLGLIANRIFSVRKFFPTGTDDDQAISDGNHTIACMTFS